MQTASTGDEWDYVNNAIGMSEMAQIKGQSLQMLIDELNLIIGKLRNINLDNEIPDNSSITIKSGVEYDKLIFEYLPKLHHYIYKSCFKLFKDGHYTQVIEESVKAVFEYIRKKTNLKLDGANLINEVFSSNKPILSFGDLNDKNIYDEQIGFMNMVKAFFQGVRSPLAHTQGKKEKMIKTFEYLVMASLFCRRIDDTKKTTS